MGPIFVFASEDPAAHIWHCTLSWGGGAGRSAGQFPSVLLFSPARVSRAHKDLNPVLPGFAVHSHHLLTASKGSSRDTAQSLWRARAALGRAVQISEPSPCFQKPSLQRPKTKRLHPSLP